MDKKNAIKATSVALALGLFLPSPPLVGEVHGKNKKEVLENNNLNNLYAGVSSYTNELLTKRVSDGHAVCVAVNESVVVSEPEPTYASTEYVLPEKPTRKTWMDWRTITSRSSKQYKLQRVACVGNHGIRMIENRYAVAIGTYFGCSVGTYIDLVLENGTVIECVVADIKQNIHTDALNIKTKFSDCASEFIVDTRYLDANAKYHGDVSKISGWESPVAKIIKYEREASF